MKCAGLLGCLIGFSILISPLPSFAEDNPTADIGRQPRINFFSPSRSYTRPVLVFFEKAGFQVSSLFSSRYVWNGIRYSEGPVWQPAASMEFHGFGVSVLGNFVLNNEANQGQFNEIDFTAYYGTSLTKLEVDVSFTMTIYPNDNPESLNFSDDCLNGNLHLAYPFGPINIFTDLAIWIVEPGGGVFWDIGIGYQRDLPLNFAISTAALFGVANGRYNRAFIAPNVSASPNLVNYSLSFPWSPVRGLIITPQFNVSTLLTSEIQEAGGTRTNLWGEINIAFNL